jgi:uncharacterized protein
MRLNILRKFYHIFEIVIYNVRIFQKKCLATKVLIKTPEKLMIRISKLSVPLTYDIKSLKILVAGKLHIQDFQIEYLEIVKRSDNISDKNDVRFLMDINVRVSIDENQVVWTIKDKNIKIAIQTEKYITKSSKLKARPVVVGFGPAGIFAALILAQAGANPIVLERGSDVDARRKKVVHFWKTGILDQNTNVQFGEGGAGTFSDGKLKIGLKDPRKIKILNELVEAGAPHEILFLNKPHIGTDLLGETVKNIREKIIRLGGEIKFNSKLSDIIIHHGKVTGVSYLNEGCKYEIIADKVILAIGNSSRDTFEILLSKCIVVEQKPFAVGVRIEHTQEMINKIQYGKFSGHPSLGAADYKLVTHLKNGRAVYTFCMCPGGSVIAATSEVGQLTTNGMSRFARDEKNSNSALLVTINKSDLNSEHPLAGIDFQRKIESAAYLAGGEGYKAPVQRLEDFLSDRNSCFFGDVIPSYKPGTEFSKTDKYLPEYVSHSLRQGILEMGEWMPGFNHPDAILTGAETRSSSPIRITRNENFEAVGNIGLFPCGEGAGYSGGIISAAVDGVKVAEKILENYLR